MTMKYTGNKTSMAYTKLVVKNA